MFQGRSLWLVVFAVIALAAACSPGSPQPQAVPAATAESQPVPTSTLAPAAPTDTPAQPAPTDIVPTAAPPQSTATSAPTATLTQTPRPRVPAATARPRSTVTPLNVTYEVVEIKRQPGEQSVLVLKVYATGGSGGYRYFHDDIQQTTATFNIAGRCGRPFVHTIKVTSADGQSVALPYHVGGVCPTPTP